MLWGPSRSPLTYAWFQGARAYSPPRPQKGPDSAYSLSPGRIAFIPKRYNYEEKVVGGDHILGAAYPSSYSRVGVYPSHFSCPGSPDPVLGLLTLGSGWVSFSYHARLGIQVLNDMGKFTANPLPAFALNL